MITASFVTKRFDDTIALQKLNCTIPEGCVYGLVGSNGSGKSTLLRLISGIYRPEEGRITIDDQEVFDNPAVKNRIVFVPDELYFLPHANLRRMEQLYASVYERFSHERFETLLKEFSLNPDKALNTFSKGMRRQAATILALSCNADYILFDETFDGLDPVMRNLVKNLLYNEVMELSEGWNNRTISEGPVKACPFCGVRCRVSEEEVITGYNPERSALSGTLTLEREEKRKSIVASCSLVMLLSGENVVSLVPLTTPSSLAHMTASE